MLYSFFKRDRNFQYKSKTINQSSVFNFSMLSAILDGSYYKNHTNATVFYCEKECMNSQVNIQVTNITLTGSAMIK